MRSTDVEDVGPGRCSIPVSVQCLSRGVDLQLGEDSAPSLRATGAHQDGEPVPQVGDLVEVLVRRSVVGQFA